MRKLLLIVLCATLAHIGFSQNPELDGSFFGVESSYEVGQNYTIGFELTSYPENFHDITYIEWRIVGGTSGFNVDGHMNYNYGTFYIENQNPPTVEEYYLDFAFGDNASTTKKIKIIIDYRYYNEENELKPGTMEKPIDVDVNTIGAPSIAGPKSIQKCCITPVGYQVYSYDEANIFTWNVTGGTLINGQGTDQILVEPSSNNTLNVSCEVGRQEAVPAYKKTASKTISRKDPVLPPIQGNDYLCLGEITEYYLDLDDLCNVTDVEWNVSSGADVISVSATKETISVSHKDNSLFSEVNIEAVVEFGDGCFQAAADAIDVDVFESGTPPTPQGYIDVITGPDFDPCSDYIVEFEFVQTDNFENGKITVDPGFFVGVPHHIGDNTTIDVEVCYENPCAEAKSCKTYTVNLPAPCEDGPQMKEFNNLKKEKEKLSEASSRSSQSELHSSEETLVYPNPVNAILNIDGNKEIHSLKLYGMNSELLLSEQDIYSKKSTINVREIEAGVYNLQIKTSEAIHYKKVIIQ